jgi:6-pyruvoyltetrahydropterin/6-carboxytetrahydropterin synthase
MRIQVSKTYRFSAAHQLACVPLTHKCATMHGHNFKATLVYESASLDSRGMVIDFAEIDAAWERFRALFDHQVLNCIPGLANPTSEEIALYLYANLGVAVRPDLARVRVVSVSVSETDDTCVTVSP